MSQPRAPKTDVFIKSRPYMTCSAIHSTMPSKIPMSVYGAVHCPPAKKGVIYDMMNPREFRMIQVMTMRFNHAWDSSTVRPEREKFIISRATAAVTMAAMVEMVRI